jgi:hypothetical protein
MMFVAWTIPILVFPGTALKTRAGWGLSLRLLLLAPLAGILFYLVVGLTYNLLLGRVETRVIIHIGWFIFMGYLFFLRLALYPQSPVIASVVMVALAFLEQARQGSRVSKARVVGEAVLIGGALGGVVFLTAMAAASISHDNPTVVGYLSGGALTNFRLEELLLGIGIGAADGVLIAMRAAPPANGPAAM